MKRWILCALFLPLVGLLTACGGGDQDRSAEQSAPPVAATSRTDSTQVFHVLAFDGVQSFKYLVHFRGPGQPATLYTRDEVHLLQPVPAASGARYQGERLMVWVKGDEVLFEVDGKRVGPCRVSGLQPILARAWLAGTRFWATGNEPSWNLVIGPERVALLTDLGETRREFPGLAAPELDPRAPFGKHVLKSGGHTLEIEILDGLCTDTMSGAPFPASVILRLDGEEMRGCGTGLF